MKIQGFLTDAIINSEIVSKFIFYLKLKKTQLFIDILKGELALFAPL